ncbi:hypothetical protein KCU98_g12219, partial [Aureobasidium melanogenum]
MGNAFCTTSQDENMGDRALVVRQPLVDRPNDHFETVIDQDDSGNSVSQPDGPFTMHSTETLDDVSAVEGSHDPAQATPERSLIPTQSTAPYIDVVVEGKSTLISKHLLCSQSSFFDRALNGSFREAHDNRVILDECYEVFQIFHTWLLEGKLEFVALNPDASVDVHVEQHQLALLEIYIFADRLGIPKLSDDALLQLDRLLRPSGRPGRASVDCIHNASAFLPGSSGLWRYLIAIEIDADQCRSPRRALADLVDLPNSFIVETRLLAAEISNAYVRIGSQPLNLFALSKQVCEYGGYGKVEQLRKWGVICLKMGVSLSFQSKIFLQVREVYAYWLGPFDEEFTSEERLVLEKRCSRPFVKQFFQSPVAHTERNG